MFEPIDIMFKYINNNDKNDSVSSFLFYDQLYNMKFYITDDHNNIYNNKFYESPFLGIQKEKYIVYPYDTLITIMDLNRYGILPEDRNKAYFNRIGYFPIGKYKGYAYTETGLRSNYIEFEITDLNDEDKFILENCNHKELLKLNDNLEIPILKNIEKYKDNSFYEYLWREKVREAHIKFGNNEITEIDLMNIFKDFIYEFPNSFYNVHYIPQYINLASSHDENKVNEIIQNLVNDNPNTTIELYINNTLTREYLINYVKNNKDHY